MKSYTLPTSRQALAAGNRISSIAREPVITGYGLRGQVQCRESSEPVLVEWDEQHQVHIYMVVSKFPGLYFLCAKVEGKWRCTAKDEADKADCIQRAIIHKNVTRQFSNVEVAQ